MWSRALDMVGTPSRAMVIASSMLLLSGCMQLAASWAQLKAKDQCRSEASVRSSTVPVTARSDDSYTWLGEDFPNALNIDLGDPVVLTMEDSKHYALNSIEAEAEYMSIYPGSKLGFIRLGPNKRFFGLSMFHQIHCVASLRKAILGITHDHRRRAMDSDEVAHTHHCLNYLRQAILCSADITLEPEVPEGSLDVGEGLAVNHVCRDWGKVYDFVRQNEAEWEAWKNETRV